jgi:tetratricopeptide (TPR) repeat protein
VLFLFLAPAIARSHSAAALQQFDSGKQAFAAQDYANALNAFESAVSAGMTGPAVHFNIGVCAYKLGRWDRAEAAFREVARTPEMAALARYNLGLVALGAGKSEEASRWFAQVERESSDERLKSLATARLAGLPSPPERNWLAFGSLAAGYDDNVALISGGDVLGVSGIDDTFAELQLAGSAPLTGNWRFDGGVVLLDYQELDSFDQMSVNAGGRYRMAIQDWTAEAGLQLTYSTLDGNGFESKRMLLLQATRPLPDDWRLRVRYRFSDIDGLEGFEGLDGTRHELGVRGIWRRDSWDVSVDYRFDKSDYAEEVLSFDRHQISVYAEYELDADWTVLASLVHDRSGYAVAENGSEERTELALTVSRDFGSQWRAFVRYAYADNQADVPEFDYDRNQFSAGVEATW